MKTTLRVSVAAFLALGLNLHSQTPVPVAPVTSPASIVAVVPAASKSTLQILLAMKAKNQELLEKQAQTLIQLEILEKEAEQMKIFAKRS